LTRYSDDFKPGDRLGKYEVIRELATGGMATIYLARVSGTAGFEKLVVLKCILPALAGDRGFVNMFLDEARIAATLRHSNIADVFDVGVEDGTYFFAMEYVHGQNARIVRLESKARQFPIPLEVSLAIIAATASALGYAHDRSSADGPLNLVHRDVSPSNVLVGFEGAIKLVDFGIARATLRRGARTRTGLKRGKAPYMSPEQCRGEAIDRRSDLFSLGTMLYELTAGQRPFVGNSDFEVMEAIVTSTPAPPSSLVRDYPSRLDDIVMRLLARSPGARYQEAGSLLEDLEAFIAERGVSTSSYVVGKYMHELFGEHATAKVDRDTITELVSQQPTHTREYPAGRPPTGVMATLRQQQHAGDDEPTAAFRRAEQLSSIDLAIKARAPRRTGTAQLVGDEPSQTSPFQEKTRQDVVLPFDPIDALSQEILEHLDDDAPPAELPAARAYRRIETLLDRALAYGSLGDVDKAVTAIELALDEEPRTDEVQDLLEHHVDTIVGVYEAMLEDPYRTPKLTKPMHELIPVPIEPRARLLLPWIDGETTVRDLITRSRMQRLEVYRHLCQFLLRGIIT
jgi:serine/threonine protein kinase